MDKDTQNIFILGLCVLFAWMAVICICASPQVRISEYPSVLVVDGLHQIRSDLCRALDRTSSISRYLFLSVFRAENANALLFSRKARKLFTHQWCVYPHRFVVVCIPPLRRQNETERERERGGPPKIVAVAGCLTSRPVFCRARGRATRVYVRAILSILRLFSPSTTEGGRRT